MFKVTESLTLESVVESAKLSADEAFQTWKSFPDVLAKRVGTNEEVGKRIVDIGLRANIPSGQVGKETSIWISRVFDSAHDVLYEHIKHGNVVLVDEFILEAIERHVRERVEAHVATLIATIDNEEAPGLPTP